jgi:hypothetical protein
VIATLAPAAITVLLTLYLKTFTYNKMLKWTPEIVICQMRRLMEMILND